MLDVEEGVERQTIRVGDFVRIRIRDKVWASKAATRTNRVVEAESTKIDFYAIEGVVTKIIYNCIPFTWTMITSIFSELRMLWSVYRRDLSTCLASQAKLYARASPRLGVSN